MSDYPPPEGYPHEQAQSPSYSPENTGHSAVYPAQEPYDFQAHPVQKPPVGAPSAPYLNDSIELPLSDQQGFSTQVVGEKFMNMILSVLINFLHVG